ncbi:hypothetical protein QBC38DRAFT_456419 [Podospora fimiseda]|uniref:Uncharacterized protein n=1 Tax=Podospora fimiseda TaxID=252190 RepID=A0AAN7BMZ3_9PEZI|nr:hypothetical protein QBC38DRAFT_456419 [Podospora fimiseda]
MRLLKSILDVGLIRFGSAATISVPWTTNTRDLDTDEFKGTYGPDGLWQALAIQVGTYTGLGSEKEPGIYTPMWPSDFGNSMVPTERAGGSYAVANSTTAVELSMLPTAWDTPTRQREQISGRGVFDMVSITPKVRVNISIEARNKWDYILPDGRNYSARVGVLGLGFSLEQESFRRLGAPQAVVESLYRRKEIASMSACLHMGSVSLKQPGSFVLGGYNQTRVIGPVGEFKWNPPVGATIFLDVILGT